MLHPVRVALVLALATFAQAAAPNVTYTLVGITMSDGAVASGSFVFNAGTNTYSSISITTSGGTVFTGQTYTAVAPSQLSFVSGSAVEFVPNPSLSNFTGTPVLVLLFSPALTSAGGTSTLTSSYEGTCLNAACTGPGPTERPFTAGAVTSTPVSTSVPAMSLFGLAFLAVLLAGSSMLLLRRRTLI